MGVSRVKSTTRNAFGPDITRRIARPVSFLINLQIESIEQYLSEIKYMLLFTNLTLHLRLSNPQSGNGYGGHKRVPPFGS